MKLNEDNCPSHDLYELEDFVETHFNDCDEKIREEAVYILETLKEDIYYGTGNAHRVIIEAHNKIVHLFNMCVDTDSFGDHSIF